MRGVAIFKNTAFNTAPTYAAGENYAGFLRQGAGQYSVSFAFIPRDVDKLKIDVTAVSGVSPIPFSASARLESGAGVELVVRVFTALHNVNGNALTDSGFSLTVEELP